MVLYGQASGPVPTVTLAIAEPQVAVHDAAGAELVHGDA